MYTKSEVNDILSHYKVKEITSSHDALVVEAREEGKIVIGFAPEIVLYGGEAN
jgi:hypothetical protein